MRISIAYNFFIQFDVHFLNIEKYRTIHEQATFI